MWILRRTTPREARATEYPAYGNTCDKCGKQDQHTQACKGGKPKPNQANEIKAAIQAGLQTVLAAPPLQPPEKASVASAEFRAFAIHCDETKSSHLPGLATQPQTAQPESSMPAKVPMPHMEFDPYLIKWVKTSPKLSLTLSVALCLHEETYAHLNVQRPTAHPHAK